VDAVKASASSASFFSLFQMEPSVDVQLSSLEAAFHRLSLKLHPDCNVGADAKTQRHALEQTTLLNEAYATLSNPVRRAFYVLKMYGVDLELVHNTLPSPFQAPPSFLNRLLELREALHQAFSARQTDKLQNLEHLAKEALHKALEAGCQCLRNHARQGGGPHLRLPPPPKAPPPWPEELQQAAMHLVCVRYWQRFLEDLTQLQEELFS
jgi:molecular chaperone HscB